jgi:hypothetical protein
MVRRRVAADDAAKVLNVLHSAWIQKTTATCGVDGAAAACIELSKWFSSLLAYSKFSLICSVWQSSIGGKCTPLTDFYDLRGSAESRSSAIQG